jgi:hypothetical protein
MTASAGSIRRSGNSEGVQVCVCGWYFRPGLYRTLAAVHVRFRVTVVGHRPGPTCDLPLVLRENVGLEWGAFSHYLENLWDGESRVLFMHDDVEASPAFFDEVAAATADQAFVFRDRGEFERAYSHGRAFVASGAFLTLLGEHGGIWYDGGNTGFVASGPSWSATPPLGCGDHNAGIRAFTAAVRALGARAPGLRVNEQLYSTNVRLGVRGVVSGLDADGPS